MSRLNGSGAVSVILTHPVVVSVDLAQFSVSGLSRRGGFSLELRVVRRFSDDPPDRIRDMARACDAELLDPLDRFGLRPGELQQITQLRPLFAAFCGMRLLPGGNAYHRNPPAPSNARPAACSTYSDRPVDPCRGSAVTANSRKSQVN